MPATGKTAAKKGEGGGGDRDMLKMINEKLDKLSDLPDGMNELKASVEFMSTMFEEIRLELEATKKLAKSQQSEINQLKAENIYLNKTVSLLREKTSHLETYSRKNNVEIHGIELLGEEEDEKTLDAVVENLATKLKITYNKADTEAIHRVKTKEKTNRPPIILVRFMNRRNAELWLSKKKTGIESREVVGDEGTSTTKIYINENLSREQKELFWQARVRGKQLGMQYVWVKNATIFMRKEEKSPIFKITKIEDLPDSSVNSSLSSSTSDSTSTPIASPAQDIKQ